MDLPVDPAMLLRQAVAPDTKGGVSKDSEQLRRHCEQFEAVFIEQMFKEMRNTIPDGGLIDGGMTEQIFTELMDHEVAQQMAAGQGLGLAEVLYRQLSGELPMPGRPDDGEDSSR